MNREDAKKLLPVIQAFAEGKDIEARCDSSVPWMREVYPSWNPKNEYRIKPEPLEFWITLSADGARCSHGSKNAAESYAKSRLPYIYTIHHMREVIE